jgi:hypothetical protein
MEQTFKGTSTELHRQVEVTSMENLTNCNGRPSLKFIQMRSVTVDFEKLFYAIQNEDKLELIKLLSVH